MRLAALEKNILVYRAIQMALFLFYAEEIKQQLIESVGREIRKHNAKLKGAKLLKAIFQRLVAENLLSKPESTELQELIEHRNQIAHQIHLLVGDVELPGRRYDFQRYLKRKYDYKALDRLKKWQEELLRRLEKRHWTVMSLNPLFFEAAEHAYLKELSLLEKRIKRQFNIRVKQAFVKTIDSTQN